MLNLYSIVSEQFPEFVRAYYPALIEFIKAYYKWMKEYFGDDYRNFVDIDKAPEEFIAYFKNQYDSDNLLRKNFNEFYIKRIKEIYSAKGSEQALIQLLKIVYNANVSIDYPGQYILKTSDGKWSQESFITLTTQYGTISSTVDYFYLVIGKTEKRVRINRIETLYNGLKRVYFDSVNKLSPYLNQYVRFKEDGKIIYVGRITKSPASLTIIDGGANWQVHQIFNISGTEKNSIGKITKVDSNGAILGAFIYEYGDGHAENQEDDILPSRNAEISDQATVRLNYDVISNLEGKWTEDSGKISNQTIRIQDNKYYQNFSYVINADVNSSEYIDVARELNPAGYKYFTTYTLNSFMNTNPDGYTRTPFLFAFLGPDIILTSDSTEFEFDKIVNDYLHTIDSIAIEISKNFEEFAIAVDQNTFTVDKVIYDSVEVTDELSFTQGVLETPYDGVGVVESYALEVDKNFSEDMSIAVDNTVFKTDKYFEETASANAGSFKSLTIIKYSSEDYFSENYESINFDVIIGE